MAKKWRDLYNKLPAERRTKIEASTAAMQREMPLHELRRARELSQQTLAELLGESQPAVSQLEQRTDMYVSTLRRYISRPWVAGWTSWCILPTATCASRSLLTPLHIAVVGADGNDYESAALTD
jgi:hypothetical protein